MNGWTPDRRRAQAEAIRRWRPWEKSTGPRTQAGKARVARNAFKGGARAKLRMLENSLRALRELDHNDERAAVALPRFRRGGPVVLDSG